MTLGEWIRTGRLQYYALWALAVVALALAFTDTSALGFDPGQLTLLGTVFAATTAEYYRRTRSGSDGEAAADC